MATTTTNIQNTLCTLRDQINQMLLISGLCRFLSALASGLISVRTIQTESQMAANFLNTMLQVTTDCNDFADNVDIVFGCLDAPLTREIIPVFKDKAVVIDNSNAFRMDPDIPLIVPEVNPQKIKDHHGILKIFSELGKGTEVRVELPVKHISKTEDTG